MMGSPLLAHKYIFLGDGWTEEVSGRRRRDSSGFELSLKVGIGTFYPHSTKFPLALVQIQGLRETRTRSFEGKDFIGRVINVTGRQTAWQDLCGGDRSL